jgi:hypothetical protein
VSALSPDYMASEKPLIGTVDRATARSRYTPGSLGCEAVCTYFARPVKWRFLGQLASLLALLAAGVLVDASSAWATVGVGVQAAPVSMPAPARPGTTSSFPSVYVINTGTQSAEYSLKIERLSTGNERTVPAGWVSFGEENFVLQPHRSTTVGVRLKLPSTADFGQYMTDIVASTTARGSGGAAAGAAAATKLVFAVSAPSPRGLSPADIVLIAAGGLVVIGGTQVGRHRRRRGDPHRLAAPPGSEVQHGSVKAQAQ